LGADDRITLEVLDRAECLRLLETVPVGRLAVTIGALPAILPVNFAIVGDRIVVRTVPGTKLDAATMHAVVAFEADSYAPDGSSGWSVMVQGLCSEVVEPAELTALGASPLRAWAFDEGAATRFVRIDLSFVSGRRFRRRPSG
jgi:nitroimidazol reductase NimA-like FMN-containing flavoprotein (pyridoxamine 5'-phosphate oxidase superfamily)